MAHLISSPRPSRPGISFAGRPLALLAAAVILALGAWACVYLYLRGDRWIALILFLGLLATVYVFTSPRVYPLRYIWPGLVFFVLLVVYPIGYTVYSAFTNYGTGHMLSKSQAVQQLQNALYSPPDAKTFTFTAFGDPKGKIVFLLKGADGQLLLAQDGRVKPLTADDPQPVSKDGGQSYERLGDLPAIPPLKLIARLSQLQNQTFAYGESVLSISSLNQFSEMRHQYKYDPQRDVLTNLATGKEYRPKDGYYTSADGQTLSPGFTSRVGFYNFTRLFEDRAIRGPFTEVFIWTLVWATLTVVIQLVAGLALGLLMNDPYLKLRNFYRSVLILPYAIPAFISALVWTGLLNTDVGVINGILRHIIGFNIPWFQSPFWAKVALFLVNLWLGYPYMMLIILGALQSIPGELYEAARVDGATPGQIIRTITLPLLMATIGPLLVGSFAFNFNNFNVIYLVTGGNPPIVGAQTPAGHTDILISYTYRLAFEGGQGNQLGFAAAISIVIFVIVAVISLIQFRFTRLAEEVSHEYV